MTGPAFEIVGDPRAGGPFLFTCEHAGKDLHGRVASAEDRPLLDDHWGWDIGAGALTRALCEHTSSAGVLSNFSRLLCDPNRPPDDPTYILTVVESHALSFNRHLDDEEIARRTRELYDPYHQAVDEAVRARLEAPDAVRLVSIHSFTPEWDGVARGMEIGVLFDDHEPEARDLAGAIGRLGLTVAHNEPYSGRGGLIYSVQRHGRAHGLHHVELEVRNDLLRTPEGVARTAKLLATALEAYKAPNA
jgi:predicted N-formylglutamate amidohydrolase